VGEPDALGREHCAVWFVLRLDFSRHADGLTSHSVNF
jgi:hypothetical protein